MMYKVGDEVLIKGEVVEVMNDVPYPVRVRLGSDNGGLVFTNDEVCYADKIVKTYEMGLNDAWKLLKKIYDMKCDAIEEIFGVKGGFYDVIRNFTFEDCRDKIEAYEREKNFCVGDEIVTSMGETFIILALADGEVYGYSNDGKHEDFPVQRIECYTESGRAEKTGMQIDIEWILKQIGE